ncbi:MAG: trehalose-phosphatase [Stygiobacter sp. RIFOXYC12_FULL_38_8]|nr:MAG: trehalose-phosphatase [Stygiobacter sp. GWC2_38_9]OGU84371.1 MAG: trehalose-phosphatase [Stygiobacter sp. RIFOXYA12_FULL_38_9]OGV09749.1 MAG: trehalose-phosphatase [Stygiobacter sp. RIFOXYB2_FULL_37_11]OGV13617.1 MAG: trehalose-phosphatase [Stygiobacter sp. RIFOXYC2_FULL_38_25]OGV16121.1 MAG: trehalose-phosphatase [Stygiobacter sp. RIFOXYA2_FULL_38_8]OGV27386.1 MAG: trehalose-phosphatase [Stygiobacter sp. RIFOXYC12_FULL_38_8]OGV80001.1 MAG: trehalose-phosphatase [Stygiobacter sp. GWF2
MKNAAPKYIFKNNDNTWANIFDGIKTARQIILFLDYDGTLVPIMEKPSLAVMSYQMEEILRDLNRKGNISIFLVTGRAHSDIKKIFRVKDVTIISNHGFQITGKNINWSHPDIKHFLPSLRKTKLLLMKKLNFFPSTFLEDKRITMTVHFRNAEKKHIPLLKKTVRNIVVNYKEDLHTTSGKKVVEVRPNIRWNKGEAVLKIMKRLRIRNEATKILYVGDDKTDEDAFKALKHKAVTIVVGRKQNSHANYYVRNTDEVQKVLQSIHSIT